MKYFNPSYWFKLWVLSAPLFNDKTQGINAKSIDNKKIKDWASKNTTDISLIENQQLNLLNNQTIQLQNNENIQSIKNLETDHFYENFLKTQGWSRDPQIAQHQLQEIQEEHHQFLKEQHAIYKRDFNAKTEIEFINNNFFYKFDINYDSGKVWGGSTSITKNLYWPIIIVPNFKKYANSWEEFEKKFPEVEFNNLRVELGGVGNDVIKKWDTFKVSTKLNKENIWNYNFHYDWNKSLSNSEELISCYFSQCGYEGVPHGVGTNYGERFNLHILAEYHDRGNVVFVPYQQDSGWMLRLFPDNDKLLVDTALYMKSNNAVYSTWGKLKYDSVRLVGEVDWNPLLALTIEQSKNIENWYLKEQKVISDNKNDPNFTPERIKNLEDSFNAEFLLWLTQLRTDFIQNLILIDHENKINVLKKEIEEIKERLANLEQSKSCIKKIVETYKTKPTISSSDKFIDTIADDKAIKEIFKATSKVFITSLIKGPLNAVLSCLVDSVIHSLTRRNIIKENQFDNRSYENQITNVNKILNTTQWDKNITNLINHEQHLPIDNKTNFITNNITSL